jgi:hypothetical protein
MDNSYRMGTIPKRTREPQLEKAPNNPLPNSLYFHRCYPDWALINTKITILLDIGLRSPNQDKSLNCFVFLNV